ncbi:enoyl-CoA hydratase/isomerase family protein [Corynebacterium mendelii]|uniref:3-hydroxyisobutyryl-CoA hydrolase n=1 Tax=Corynebacterium mendelii TaxID=2765362 RepID=A0A939E1H7_9CORY|nr:enoyl-CoA hydratase/isomerase family protein [Corynebacterium mendelii]MBN9644741.1 enoyl-CoA hydratase/isomerase family protein [Corynebacterium mendelii]
MTHRGTENLVYAFARNSTGVLALNRPKALNSLNHEMVEIITGALEQWRDDDSVHRVVIYSTSGKAFCAGGDVRMSREAALAGNHAPADQFFTEEYELNDLLANFPKPVVAVIDGIVMGGGLGISMHGSHRVITEKALAAMPEMAIGFCPDVGATWMFPRMSSEQSAPSKALAQFLCLTGYRMNAADMLYTGLATDFVATGDAEAFTDMLIAESLDEALEFYSGPRPTGSRLKAMRDDIEACFDFDHFADIEAALADHPNREFCQMVADLFAPANPTSLVATAELIAANCTVTSIRKALDNEFTMGARLRRDANFVEGVRAVLVDKDRSPHFDPATTGAVDAAAYADLVD